MVALPCFLGYRIATLLPWPQQQEQIKGGYNEDDGEEERI